MPRKYYTREFWDALPPKHTYPATPGPAEKVVLTYSTNTLTCNNLEDCSVVLKKLQLNHFRRGMSDIAFNFLVGGDGNIYEGRGWGLKPSQTLFQVPKKRVDIAFIGRHSKMDLPTKMFKGALECIMMGVRKNCIVRQWDLIDIDNVFKGKKNKWGSDKWIGEEAKPVEAKNKMSREEIEYQLKYEPT